MRTIVYHTGHEKSYNVCRNISYTTGFPLKHVSEYEVGVRPIVYGLFRDTDRVMRKARWAGTGFWYVDHGFWDRGHYFGNYRFVFNGVWPMNVHSHMYTIRNEFEASIPVLKPMYRPEKVSLILLCAPALEGSMFLPLYKVWPEEWVEGISYRLKARYPDAEIIVSTKHSGNTMFDHYSKKPSLIVSHDSNAMITALIDGFPAANLSNGSISSVGMVLDAVKTEERRERYLTKASMYHCKLAELNAGRFNKYE